MYPFVLAVPPLQCSCGPRSGPAQRSSSLGRPTTPSQTLPFQPRYPQAELQVGVMFAGSVLDSTALHVRRPVVKPIRHVVLDLDPTRLDSRSRTCSALATAQHALWSPAKTSAPTPALLDNLLASLRAAGISRALPDWLLMGAAFMTSLGTSKAAADESSCTSSQRERLVAPTLALCSLLLVCSAPSYAPPAQPSQLPHPRSSPCFPSITRTSTSITPAASISHHVRRSTEGRPHGAARS